MEPTSTEEPGVGCADARRTSQPPPSFEALYRGELDGISAFFARRSRDPMTVADLTADTFVEALRSYRTFDPVRGTARPWLYAIARNVYARRRLREARDDAAESRAAARRAVDDELIEDLLERIDSQRAGRQLLARLAGAPQIEREAIELVDLGGLAPREAAAVLNLSAGAFRVRLSRARARLRREGAEGG